MKFTAKTKDVQNAVKKASACLSNKGMLPILNNALFEASADGYVTVTCTDLYQRITASFPAEVEIPASTTIPAKKLLSILGNLHSDAIIFSTKENGHTDIICGTAQIDIYGLDAKDFPEKTENEAETTFTIEAKEYAELIKHGGFAVSSDEARKVLTGVLFEVDSNGIISVVSSDGKRLAVAEKQCNVETEEVKKYIIPAAVIANLSKLKGDNIEFELSEKYMTAKLEDVTFSAKILDGNFPNWRAVLPNGLPLKAVISSGVLLNKLALVSQMLSPDSQRVICEFGVNQIAFKTQSDDGSILDSMEVEFLPPDDKLITLMFNPAFIIDAVQHCGDDTFVFNFKDGGSPCVFDFGNNVKYSLMPIRPKQ